MEATEATPETEAGRKSVVDAVVMPLDLSEKPISEMTIVEREFVAIELAKELVRRADERSANMTKALELERKAHHLWDEAFTNCVMANPSAERRKAYIEQTYEATRLHREAVELLDPNWA